MDISRKPILLMTAILGAVATRASARLVRSVRRRSSNPRLKSLEKANLDKLLELNSEITDLKFPFKFTLRRFVGLDSRQPPDADSRGIEFVKFHDRTILKISGNYTAAFNSDLLSQNERANHVLDDVVTPILPLLAKYFPDDPSFDAFGFEISFHVRTENKQFGYEGRETLTLVFDKAGRAAFPQCATAIHPAGDYRPLAGLPGWQGIRAGLG